ncbi:MAG: hypothetical protein E2P03_00115 [Acidobacteria bacterium]|nr:MAG: hypothetical protein E2P03_00115 [Acidobacteriota bacterium]
MRELFSGEEATMGRAKGGRSKLMSIAIGCLSIIFLIVGIAGILVVWAGLSYRSLGAPTSDTADLSIAVGDRAAPPASEVSPSVAINPVATPPAGTALATLSPSEFPGANRSPVAVRLNISFSEGNFEIVPGPPGSDITVEGSYATNYYELVEERVEDENGMEVSLRLKPKAGWFTRMIAGLNHFDHNHPNDLTVRIPPDIPIDLNIQMDAGQSRVELGGLTLTDLDVDLSKGDFKLSFNKPLAAPLPRMAVSMQMGDGRVSGLGNARAGEIVVDTGMGGFRVSLNGDWPAGSDSKVTIDHSMGDLTLIIPTDVRIAEDSSNMVILGGSMGRLKDDKNFPVAANAATLHLDVNTSMGGVTVRRSHSSSADGR